MAKIHCSRGLPLSPHGDSPLPEGAFGLAVAVMFIPRECNP